MADKSQSQQVRRRRIGLALAVLSAVSFGSLGYFAHIMAGEGFSIVASFALRFSLAALVLWLVDALLRRREPVQTVVTGADRLASIVFGAIGYGLSAGLFFVAMERTSTGLANILLFQHPIIVLALTWLTRRGGGLPWTIVGAVAVGLVLVLWPTDSHFDVLGVLAGVGSAVWYGGYLFLTEARSQRLPSRLLTLDVLVGCAGAFVLVGALTGQLQLPHTPLAWGALVAQALLCTIVPVLALFAAFRYAGARDATLASALEPVVTVAIGVSLLGEPLSLLQCVGAVLLIGAIVGVARRETPPQSSLEVELPRS